MVAREHRKQKKRRRAGSEEQEGEDGDVVHENDQGLVISHCSLDYQRIYDVTRLRIHKMRQALKAEAEDKRSIQDFECQDCYPPRRYTTLQANELIHPDGQFHCPECNSIVRIVGETTSEDGVSRKKRKETVKKKQEELEEELKPINVVLAEIERHLSSGGHIPDFGTLNQWAAQEAARMNTHENGRTHKDDVQPEINISMDGGQVQAATTSSDTAPRELPPWLQRQGASQSASASPSGLHDLSLDLHGLVGASDNRNDYNKIKEDEKLKEYKERLAEKKEMDEGFKHEPRDHKGGWQEVTNLQDHATETELSVKQEHGADALLNTSAGLAPTTQDAEEDDEDWEDA